MSQHYDAYMRQRQWVKGEWVNDPCTPKTPEKKMTREEVLAAREGYTRAMMETGLYLPFRASILAAQKFPLPTKTVPRTAFITGRKLGDAKTYTYENGQFWFTDATGNKFTSRLFNDASRSEIEAILDLRNNPTCEVPE